MSTDTRGRVHFNLQPLSHIPLRQEVYGSLRRMIVHGHLAPGAKIIEGRVASALGVSRTPVREALRQLESDGLVVTRPGYSTRVTTLTISDVEEIYPLIAVLEGLAARLATPRLTNSDLRYMEEITAALARHARSGQIEKLIAADNQFHGVLHERSQNQRLQRIVAELRGQMERFEYIFFRSKETVAASMQRHKKLVRVLRRRNPAASQGTLQRQWDLGRRALVGLLRKKKMAIEEPPEAARLREALTRPAARPAKVAMEEAR